MAQLLFDGAEDLAVAEMSPWLDLRVPPREVKLPAVISEHMVLQRDMPVPIWGWAAPAEEVTVSIAGQTQTATAGPD